MAFNLIVYTNIYWIVFSVLFCIWIYVIYFHKSKENGEQKESEDDSPEYYLNKVRNKLEERRLNAEVYIVPIEWEDECKKILNQEDFFVDDFNKTSFCGSFDGIPVLSANIDNVIAVNSKYGIIVCLKED